MAKKSPAAPAAPKAQSQNNPAGGPMLGPGIQLPPGISIQHPVPSFPPGLQQSLDEARRTGRYFIAVVTMEENGDLRANSFRSSGFDPRGLLESWQLVASDVLMGKLGPRPVVSPDPPDAGAE